MNTKKYLSAVAILGTVVSLAAALPALADTGNSPGQNPPQQGWGAGRVGQGRGAMMRPGVFGTVTSISGDTITVTSMGRRGPASTTPSTTTTFTVDATNAVVMKANATSSVSSIAVGDVIAVQGTVTGTNVVATKINDGLVRGKGAPTQGGQGQVLGALSGNGEPVVAGTISSISGNTITITNKSNVAYTVDATSAKISQGQNATASISNLTVGDSVLVQGTVNGTSITASTVIDQGNSSSNSPNNTAKPKGFFGGIGSFFMHLFGF